ncbi:MAG: PqqD family protein [Lachnospiraceae bacterium]
MLRKVAGDHVVVPVGEAGKVFHGMIRLNDTRAFFGNSAEGNDEGTGLQAMAEKCEVDESVAADDLDRFLQQLRNAEILEETNE